MSTPDPTSLLPGTLPPSGELVKLRLRKLQEAVELSGLIKIARAREAAARNEERRKGGRTSGK